MFSKQVKFIIYGIFTASSLTLALYLFAPTLLLTAYKPIYIGYIHAYRYIFGKTFTDRELENAIEKARLQPWVQQQIAADLAPFKDGITGKQLDDILYTMQQANSQQLFRVIIHDQQAYIKPVPANISIGYAVFYATIKYLAAKGHIPNCEFVVSLNDYLTYIPKHITNPVPIFTFAKHSEIPVEQNTILLPDWMNIQNWDYLNGRITLANKIFPWTKKQNVIFWRGGLADSMQHRAKFLALDTQFSFVDAKLTGGNKPAPNVAPEISLKNKYQIALDGHRGTWERMVWQMHGNSVMIKPNSPQVQWFHKGLVPYQNYIPIADISPEQITAVYDWLQQHDDQAYAIAQNANAFAQANLNIQDLYAYYVVLLQEYAKLYKN
jgi:hypothetical protein